MRLLFQEIKKIFHPIIIGILIIFGLVYYVLFSSFYIQYYVNGSGAQATFDLAKEWSEKYGNTLEEEEFEKIVVQLDDEKQQFTEMLTNIQMATDNGISSYEEFRAFESAYYENNSGKDADPDTERIIWTIIGNTNAYRIQSLEETIRYYQENVNGNMQDFFAIEDKTDAEIMRLKELDASKIKFGYIPSCILDSTTGLTISFMIWVIVSVIILLSPTVVRDRLNRVQGLQYCSVTGRRILSVQVRAALVSSLVLSLINLMVYGGLLISKGALVFKDFYLYAYEYVPWFNWTYGTYLIVLAFMALVIGVMTAFLTVFLSRYSQNYISMLIKAILLLAILIFAFSMLPIVTRPFFMFNPLSLHLRIKGIEFMLLAGLCAFSVLLMSVALIRQKRKELI